MPSSRVDPTKRGAPDMADALLKPKPGGQEAFVIKAHFPLELKKRPAGHPEAQHRPSTATDDAVQGAKVVENSELVLQPSALHA